MSFTYIDGKSEQLFDQKSSDSEDNYQTDEEVDSEDNISGSMNNIQNIAIDSSHFSTKSKKCFAKDKRDRKSVSLKYSRFNRQFGAYGKLRKTLKEKKCIKFSKKNKNNSLKEVGVSHKGKRCRPGGKGGKRSKGKLLEEVTSRGNSEKFVSDDDSDNFYIGRISLGYFQNFKDNSGASTSNQWEEDSKNTIPLQRVEETRYSHSEELELLELQKWGRTAIVSCCMRKTNDLDCTDLIKPEKL